MEGYNGSRSILQKIRDWAEYVMENGPKAARAALTPELRQRHLGRVEAAAEIIDLIRHSLSNNKLIIRERREEQKQNRKERNTENAT